MDLINNSTIDTVIDFANVKFGMELTKDQVSEQLRNLSFSETLKLINSTGNGELPEPIAKGEKEVIFSKVIVLGSEAETSVAFPGYQFPFR